MELGVEMKPVKTFRDDINGLRAWAVISVILFHFGIPGFSGGFVGVDVFFVISGFLMTGIIIRALEKTRPDGKHSLSLLDFYLSRGRRIIPALLILCMTLLAAGWFFLPSTEYRQLGSHSTSALGFLSNIKFWSEAGYFDAASHEKWLLHTWSLSVEWQFYIILPVILLLVWKIAPGRKAATILTAGLLLLSLSISVLTSHTSPSAAFYMLHTRAWEMLAGGLAFLLTDRLSAHFHQSMRQWFYYLGFALIALSIAAFDSATTWPGWNALVPVVGTVMVLLAARQKGVLSGHSILQRMGDWSYSLYLWHWPLAVALVYLNLQENMAAISACLTMTLILGWASFRFIESPSRTLSSKASAPRNVAIFAAVTALAAIPGTAIYLKDGVNGRLPSELVAIFEEANNKNPRMKECHVGEGSNVPGCTYGGRNLGAIVIGDSHAASIVRTVESVLPSSDSHVLDWTYSSCQTVKGLKRINDSNYRCGEFLEKARQRNTLMDATVPLIVANRISALFWGGNELVREGRPTSSPSMYLSKPHDSWSNAYRAEIREGFVSMVCNFSETRPVFILKPIPELILNVPKTMARAAQRGESVRVSITMEAYKKRNEYAIKTIEIAANRCGATILDPVPLLCDDEICMGDVGGLPIYYDDDHLNERGAKLLTPLFQQMF